MHQLCLVGNGWGSRAQQMAAMIERGVQRFVERGGVLPSIRKPVQVTSRDHISRGSRRAHALSAPSRIFVLSSLLTVACAPCVLFLPIAGLPRRQDR
jgi:hypothetical protein